MLTFTGVFSDSASSEDQSIHSRLFSTWKFNLFQKLKGDSSEISRNRQPQLGLLITGRCVPRNFGIATTRMLSLPRGCCQSSWISRQLNFIPLILFLLSLLSYSRSQWRPCWSSCNGRRPRLVYIR